MAAGAETIRNWTQRPEALAEQSAHLVDEGFTGLKFDPIPQSRDGGATGAPWELSQAEYDHTARACEAIRDAVGTRADILIGTHGQITPSAAVRLAKRMEPYDPLWFEEPCPPRNFKEMGEIARETSIPIATGERLVSPHEFQNLFAEGACAFAQPDLGSAGGITACKKIATLAEVNYVLMAPHIWGGPLITAAAILQEHTGMLKWFADLKPAFISTTVLRTACFLSFAFAFPAAHGQFMNEDAPLVPAPPLVTDGAAFSNWEHRVGEFTIAWQGSSLANAQLAISTIDQADNAKWLSMPGTAFVLAATASADAASGTGYSHLIEQVSEHCNGHSVESSSLINETLVISGILSCGDVGSIPYDLSLSEIGAGQLQFDLRVDSDNIGRTGLLFQSWSMNKDYPAVHNLSLTGLTAAVLAQRANGTPPMPRSHTSSQQTYGR